MKKYIEYILLGILMSLYIFPVTFVAFPYVNSKMVMALLGLCALYFHFCRNKDAQLQKTVAIMSALAAIVSLVGFISIVLNNTNDSAYASYIVSMWVWLAAAYLLCIFIKKVHNGISLELICYYFIAVSVIQCIIAIAVDYIPSFKQVIDSLIIQDQDVLTKGERLYGFGASLDTAGIRFSVSLSMIVYLLCKNSYKYNTTHVICFVIAYMVVLIVGNMIARTTLVGFIFSVILLFWLKRESLLILNVRIAFVVIIILSVITILSLSLYHNNAQFNEQIRFGFEPFFNYFEAGDFATSSNKQLKNMYVFPDNLKTWMIGDGYFDNPNTHDPYYVGQTSKLGFYKGTDVGYLRLIFYFGLIGLLSFISFLVYTTKACCKNSPDGQVLFYAILILNLIIWLKVATDLFFVMALFACLTNLQENKV